MTGRTKTSTNPPTLVIHLFEENKEHFCTLRKVGMIYIIYSLICSVSAFQWQASSVLHHLARRLRVFEPCDHVVAPSTGTWRTRRTLVSKIGWGFGGRLIGGDGHQFESVNATTSFTQKTCTSFFKVALFWGHLISKSKEGTYHRNDQLKIHRILKVTLCNVLIYACDMSFDIGYIEP